MCLVFAAIGAFVINTPVVVLGLPIILEWAKQNKVSASKFLLSLSYITSGSGFLTLIGNSSNIVVNGIYTAAGFSPLTFYEFFYLGSILCLLTIIYLMTYVLWILPDEVRGAKNAQRASIRFANRFSSKKPPMNDRHEQFVTVIRMSHLANQEKHTKAFKLYSNLLGKNESNVMKALGFEGVTLEEIIRPLTQTEEQGKDKESSSPMPNLQSNNHSKDDSTTSTADSVVIEYSKEMESPNLNLKESSKVRIRTPIPKNVLIEKDDVLIFKGSPKSILLLQDMVFEQDTSHYEEESFETTKVVTNHDLARTESTASGDFNVITRVVIGERLNPALQISETNKKMKTNVEQFDSKTLEFFEVVIGPSNPCVGEEYQEFEKRYRLTVLAIRNFYFTSEKDEHDLKTLTVNIGDTLLVVGKTNFYINFHDSHREFYMISRFNEVAPSFDAFKSKPFLLKVPFSKRILHLWWWEHWIFLFFFAMIGCSIAGFPMVQCTFICFCVVIAFGLISPSAAIDSVDWGLVALVGASFGIGTAITQSGVGQGITEVLKNSQIPSILLPTFVTGITLIIANIITSSACAAICIPIAISVAQAYHLNPRCFVMCVAYACQAGFAFPLGFSGNLLIMGIAGYRFLDFAKTGLPLTIIYWIVISVLAPLIWGLERPNF
ncbi:hypothetical protein FDP41_003976 [Naegleria fowleri]|uniref:RCK C-terminal domain-containing protein n=1 Tax=Naegleria fowleri TaxID=5763 RepID=A0A6A5BHH8_NAEFO|nr:uncharacterized protein FDP41_003976 [Naegleria fowleri]KAF0977323.1 hypothetical protein FDP41_003976 [Naegleria fowleri]